MGNICVFSEYLYLKPVLCEKEIHEGDFTNFQTANFSLMKTILHFPSSTSLYPPALYRNYDNL